MTVHQEANMLIDQMPEESVRLIIDLIHHMVPAKDAQDVDQLTSNRIGAGKGVIYYPENFDKWDDEVAALFHGDV